MQRTIRTLGIKLRVLPAFKVLARQILLPWHILPKEELLLWHQFQAERILQIEEADLLIFVVVEPIEYLFDHCLFGGEAPTLDDLGELINGNVASVMSIKLVESFPQRLVLCLELGQ
jgi:hypothetical protein